MLLLLKVAAIVAREVLIAVTIALKHIEIANTQPSNTQAIKQETSLQTRFFVFVNVNLAIKKQKSSHKCICKVGRTYDKLCRKITI
jgi:hypothetical protein